MIERLARFRGLALGFVSSIMGSYSPEQVLLDISAGSRTWTSLYSGDLQTPMRLLVQGRGGQRQRLGDRDRARRHAAGGRRARQPGADGRGRRTAGLVRRHAGPFQPRGDRGGRSLRPRPAGDAGGTALAGCRGRRGLGRVAAARGEAALRQGRPRSAGCPARGTAAGGPRDGRCSSRPACAGACSRSEPPGSRAPAPTCAPTRPAPTASSSPPTWRRPCSSGSASSVPDEIVGRADRGGGQPQPRPAQRLRDRLSDVGPRRWTVVLLGLRRWSPGRRGAGRGRARGAAAGPRAAPCWPRSGCRRSCSPPGRSHRRGVGEMLLIAVADRSAGAGDRRAAAVAARDRGCWRRSRSAPRSPTWRSAPP